MIPVSSVMTPDAVTVPQTMTVGELVDKINQRDPRLTRHQALLLVDADNALSGIVTRGDLLKAVNNGHSDLTLLEAGTDDLWVAFPGDTVRDAMSRMFQANVGRLPVVAPDHPTQILGYLSRANILTAHQRHMQEEQEIEQGWVRRPKKW
jgi:Mg/Co/Ni transporter MgtE